MTNISDYDNLTDYDKFQISVQTMKIIFIYLYQHYYEQYHVAYLVNV